jgi:hypothetical protein
MHEEHDYDFFIAHAGTDTVEAEAFFELLAREAKVFLDTKCLLPGDDWPVVIQRAQRGPRVTLVLISDRTEQAFYEREEIAAAIELAREKVGAHRVVPVYLAGRPPKDVPYGLRQKHALVVTDGMPVEEIAGQLLDLHRILTADEPARRPELPLRPTHSSHTIRDLVDQVFCRDPVDGLQAAAELGQAGRSAVPLVVARLTSLKPLSRWTSSVYELSCNSSRKSRLRSWSTESSRRERTGMQRPRLQIASLPSTVLIARMCSHGI